MAIVSKIRKSRGFTLVELMIVVVIIGILAALAIYGVRKYVSSSKTAEARLALGAISKGAVASFEGESMAGSLLEPGNSIGSARRLCGSTGMKTVPEDISGVKGGQKYQSKGKEWEEGDRDNGWACLKFSLTGPQYFMYGYVAPTTGPTDAAFTASATADMDGDGTNALFELSGKFDDATNTLAIAPAVKETRPEE